MVSHSDPKTLQVCAPNCRLRCCETIQDLLESAHPAQEISHHHFWSWWAWKQARSKLHLVRWEVLLRKHFFRYVILSGDEQACTGLSDTSISKPIQVPSADITNSSFSCSSKCKGQLLEVCLSSQHQVRKTKTPFQLRLLIVSKYAQSRKNFKVVSLVQNLSAGSSFIVDVLKYCLYSSLERWLVAPFKQLNYWQRQENWLVHRWAPLESISVT